MFSVEVILFLFVFIFVLVVFIFLIFVFIILFIAAAIGFARFFAIGILINEGIGAILVDGVFHRTSFALEIVLKGVGVFLVIADEVGDFRTSKWFTWWADGIIPRLWINPIASNIYSPPQPAIDVGKFFRGVIAVAIVFHSSIEFIEVCGFLSFGIGVAINGKTIECIGDGFALARQFFEMNGCNVIMIVIAFATMPAEVI